MFYVRLEGVVLSDAVMGSRDLVLNLEPYCIIIAQELLYLYYY